MFDKSLDRRTLTGTTANICATKPREDLDHAIEEFELFEEIWYLTSPYEFESEYVERKQSLEDRVKRAAAVIHRRKYDSWISKFFRKLKQFMWDDMDRIDRGFVYVAFAYAVVCFVIFY